MAPGLWPPGLTGHPGTVIKVSRAEVISYEDLCSL